MTTSIAILRHLARLGRHALSHAHEVVLGILLEGSKIEIATVCVVLGALLIVFALQMAVPGEGPL